MEIKNINKKKGFNILNLQILNVIALLYKNSTG